VSRDENLEEGIVTIDYDTIQQAWRLASRPRQTGARQDRTPKPAR
jgi:hypothetical protein